MRRLIVLCLLWVGFLSYGGYELHVHVSHGLKWGHEFWMGFFILAMFTLGLLAWPENKTESKPDSEKQ